MKYKVSVVMSVYNENEKDLLKAIDSILNQSFADFEFVIVLDNPNNIEAHKLIENKAKKDKRIKLIINKDNLGLPMSLNIGINNTSDSVKYIARMDADDISEYNRLEIQYKYMEENPNVDIVSTNKIDIDEDDNIINIPSHIPTTDKEIKKCLKFGSVINHTGAFFKKDKIVAIGKYRNFKNSQDYDLWLRASYNGLIFANIDKPLIKYRIRSNNISNTNPLKQFCIKKYIQKLYKERIRKGDDSFSEKLLNDFLEYNNVDNKKNIEKFKNGMEYMNKCKMELRNKRFLIGLNFFIHSIVSHKKMKYMWYDIVMINRIKRK